mmetsp:Transcript_15230/g.28675  ORF Transcript_15230/g.28675 Transcript_15230/m.28675 type:complete len:122 (+) Transcript_15230:107-472(+)
MLQRTRSHSPGKTPKERENRRRSLNIKLKSGDDFSHVGESFTDPVIQQIKSHVPTQSMIDGNLNYDLTTKVSNHINDVLLPEEWLELEPVYLCTPPSLDTKEFQDILTELNDTHIRPVRPK